jgi:ribosome biogenesis GTPase
MTAIFERLGQLGLKPNQLQQVLALAPNDKPWRVRSVERGACGLISAASAESDSAPPFVTCAATPKPEAPVAVGDWVLLEALDDDHQRIAHILERNTWLRRGEKADHSGAQLIAANLDVVFIVCALASTAKLEQRGVNARRVERYVAAVVDGSAEPVILLNKADLSHDAQAREDALRARLKSVPVHSISAAKRSGMTVLEQYLCRGQSVAFVGMSGVGKSTLVNALLGEDVLDTGTIREVDVKGKHTTTRRELLVMPGGALLIDTPGMRELALTSEEGAPLGFDDVETLAARCRFADCGHDTEPGCAVQRAVRSGELPIERLRHFAALEREVLRQRARHDAQARHLQNKEFKRLGRHHREAGKVRARKTAS